MWRRLGPNSSSGGYFLIIRFPFFLFPIHFTAAFVPYSHSYMCTVSGMRVLYNLMLVMLSLVHFLSCLAYYASIVTMAKPHPYGWLRT